MRISSMTARPQTVQQSGDCRAAMYHVQITNSQLVTQESKKGSRKGATCWVSASNGLLVLKCTSHAGSSAWSHLQRRLDWSVLQQLCRRRVAERSCGCPETAGKGAGPAAAHTVSSLRSKQEHWHAFNDTSKAQNSSGIAAHAE